ncbi:MULTISPECIES: HAMP domain-containing sensor histidine kinase [unclassified Paenibacillus]|uniref:sensor histidine kinase n=1 Tax=unclassified Paenibacillus TaxID=185978 RepID=UPI0024067B8F|nr:MULTISPECIES: HAMP domain-containing sensor histidine kinase [unclassified Paenibacillus]MDF9843602.1 two-component system sensor histidine kinase VanS [Paenibacillus sp. PastF-2]MDF9850191.1 two-component system sensor histidine kinase VanS [Paenibacillus sp. PastM-2]MDF9856869.1 two-component system sensor histidine kinase VanS [Paenibacillus sp. PastF-1]MDH6482038.1 two-component system sensor histidine kinase VanS [Paenibacillus sp. PastH-2]MDH6509462.1 two-component system sensor histi
MRRQGITFKLFVMTVIFFLCFYGMVILSQLLFFDGFYQQQKEGRVEKHLKSFGASYISEQWSGSRLSQELARFMLRNKTQLAIVKLDGKMNSDDPYHMKLRTKEGRELVVSLSMFMSEYGEALRAADIKEEDTLTLEGELFEGDSSTPDLIYPVRITASGGTIGMHEEGMTRLSGTVTEIVLPDLKIWNPRQGILLEALEEWFPLTSEHKAGFEQLEMQKQEWTAPWSGIRNSVIIFPVRQTGGEIELLFTVTSLQDVKDSNEALRWFFLYLGLGGLALILILSLFFSKMVTRPLIKLNNIAKRMVSLDFTGDNSIRQKDELGSLSNSMFTLSVSLDSALRELREANRQLVEEMEHKQRMEIMQQDFFANASHELKTPLSIIKGFAEGLEDGVSAGKQDHYIKVIIEEADKMEFLVKDMLDLARLESGTIKLQKSSFMLSELTEKVADKLIHLLDGKGLKVVVIPVNEPPVYADSNWIEQVVLNFMTNAIRHADEGSTVTVRIDGQGQTCVFSIHNQGEPVPEDQLQQIWERFYRAEPSRSRLTGGTGLGLSITKRILDMHGCRYKVENIGNGVCFSVFFEG